MGPLRRSWAPFALPPRAPDPIHGSDIADEDEGRAPACRRPAFVLMATDRPPCNRHSPFSGTVANDPRRATPASLGPGVRCPRGTEAFGRPWPSTRQRDERSGWLPRRTRADRRLADPLQAEADPWPRTRTGAGGSAGDPALRAARHPWRPTEPVATRSGHAPHDWFFLPASAWAARARRQISDWRLRMAVCSASHRAGDMSSR